MSKYIGQGSTIKVMKNHVLGLCVWGGGGGGGGWGRGEKRGERREESKKLNKK